MSPDGTVVADESAPPTPEANPVPAPEPQPEPIPLPLEADALAKTASAYLDARNERLVNYAEVTVARAALRAAEEAYAKSAAAVDQAWRELSAIHAKEAETKAP